jgi:hypothetical protein
MSTHAVAGHSYALLADGATAEIRPAGPGDFDAVARFHRDMSPDNLYLRFFSLSKRAGEQEARRVCRPADADHAALLALLGPQVVGLASYELTGTPGVAEIAFAVADDMHGRGSPPCCSSIWCRSAGPGGCRPSRRPPCRGTPPCCGCSPTPAWPSAGAWSTT